MSNSALVDVEKKTKQTVIKARTCFLESNSVWVVLSFGFRAIKTENAATVQCDAFQIEIFSQQEEPLFVPPTHLLVAVASMTDLPVRVFSIVRCVICFVVASFALWFCVCAILYILFSFKGMIYTISN